MSAGAAAMLQRESSATTWRRSALVDGCRVLWKAKDSLCSMHGWSVPARRQKETKNRREKGRGEERRSKRRERSRDEEKTTTAKEEPREEEKQRNAAMLKIKNGVRKNSELITSFSKLAHWIRRLHSMLGLCASRDHCDWMHHRPWSLNVLAS